MEVKQEDVGAAEALLRFMYTGELAAAVAGSAEQLMRVLCVAEYFQVCMGCANPGCGRKGRHQGDYGI